MALVSMEFRQPARRSGNLFGKDDEPRPHDEQMENAWIADARLAVVKKAMLGCEVTDEELSIADITMAEAKHEAALLLERTETQRKRLTEPPEPKEPQLPRVVSHTEDGVSRITAGGDSAEFTAQTLAEPADVEPEPEPAPKRRRKKRDMRSVMRRAIDHKREERLFED